MKIWSLIHFNLVAFSLAVIAVAGSGCGQKREVHKTGKQNPAVQNEISKKLKSAEEQIAKLQAENQAVNAREQKHLQEQAALQQAKADILQEQARLKVIDQELKKSESRLDKRLAQRQAEPQQDQAGLQQEQAALQKAKDDLELEQARLIELKQNIIQAESDLTQIKEEIARKKQSLSEAAVASGITPEELEKKVAAAVAQRETQLESNQNDRISAAKREVESSASEKERRLLSILIDELSELQIQLAQVKKLNEKLSKENQQVMQRAEVSNAIKESKLQGQSPTDHVAEPSSPPLKPDDRIPVFISYSGEKLKGPEVLEIRHFIGMISLRAKYGDTKKLTPAYVSPSILDTNVADSFVIETTAENVNKLQTRLKEVFKESSPRNLVVVKTISQVIVSLKMNFVDNKGNPKLSEPLQLQKLTMSTADGFDFTKVDLNKISSYALKKNGLAICQRLTVECLVHLRESRLLEGIQFKSQKERDSFVAELDQSLKTLTEMIQEAQKRRYAGAPQHTLKSKKTFIADIQMTLDVAFFDEVLPIAMPIQPEVIHSRGNDGLTEGGLTEQLNILTLLRGALPR